MKLKEYNAENSKNIVVGAPYIRVVRKSGTISFSKGAIDLMGIGNNSAAVVSNDEDSPRDWYVCITTSYEPAFKIRYKTAPIGAMFNCSKIAKNLLDAVGEFKSASLKISKEPISVNGTTYFLIITSKAK